jgi:hypothetical protein
VTKTDDRGEFYFSGVPPEPLVKRLRIEAKGQQVDVEVSLGTQPLIVGFNPGAQ